MLQSSLVWNLIIFYRYQKHSRQHSALLHGARGGSDKPAAGRELFATDESAEQEILFTEPAAEPIRQVNSAASDENTNDFLIQMKKRLKSVSKENNSQSETTRQNGERESRVTSLVGSNSLQTKSSPNIGSMQQNISKTTIENKRNTKVTNITQISSCTRRSKASDAKSVRTNSDQVEIFPFTDNIPSAQRHHGNPGARSRSKPDTPTSQLSETSTSPRRAALDAKTLIQEEKQKFEEYKR